MSFALAVARIDQIERALAPPAPAPPPAATAAATAVATPPIAHASAFATALRGAAGGYAATAAPYVPGLVAVPGAAAGGAPAMVAIAQGEVGQAEQPPGSNDSPRIAVYRQATAGSGVGPWCAYFVSWAAQQAGLPLGEQGQGFGSVDALYAWAQRAGRAVADGPGVVPRPGDLIVWDEHIGIVEQVLPDGRVQTLEGNSSDAVSRNVHALGSALGYVRMS